MHFVFTCLIAYLTIIFNLHFVQYPIFSQLVEVEPLEIKDSFVQARLTKSRKC